MWLCAVSLLSLLAGLLIFVAAFVVVKFLVKDQNKRYQIEVTRLSSPGPPPPPPPFSSFPFTVPCALG